ncbi:dienelactone hydrolase family protein [Dictyobacter arantiisoli]|uniref:Carboxymethylenebutenolidase n=1 Tax=Dictyobacter arantiisoli TaxID=2014874 RepID=A0A5A5TGD2_9CHLR|nr:dienelactone hydrolase family protein [Dictyobacter arantiisoli]GCF10640.1 carboxymethylenebutenolidase [Dictyobacter arantiisoli]
MCYDDNARPPVPSNATGHSHGEDVVLTAADGNRFAAYIAIPDKPQAAQVIIYPDIRGLHQFYKELALRFAEAGIQAIAFDYFGRTAGLTTRDDSFEFMPHVQQLHLATLFADVQATLNYLKQTPHGKLPIFTVGFCLGGSLSFLSGTQNFGWAGVIGFYAGLSRNMDNQGTVIERASEIKYPVLGLFGGADQGIPAEQVHQLEQKLEETGVKHQIITYAGAPHSFFDRRSAEFANASTDAWKRIFTFIHTNSSK